MRWCLKVFYVALFLGFVPVESQAQIDICQGSMPVPQEGTARMEWLAVREQVAEAHRDWQVKLFFTKNAIPNNSLQALCIFRIELMNQADPNVVSVKAPKELIPAIEEAIQRLDVTRPQPVRKNVELTSYVLIASTRPQDTQGLRAVPAALQPVVAQLKNILPESEIFLADTVVLRGTERSDASLRGEAGTSINGAISIREGTPAVVRLDRLGVGTNGVAFQTGVDIPVGSQVLVGKATSGAKAVILVMTAKILD